MKLTVKDITDAKKMALLATVADLAYEGFMYDTGFEYRDRLKDVLIKLGYKVED